MPGADRAALGAAWLSAAVAVAAFFLPWVRLDLPTQATALGRLGRITLEVRKDGRTVSTDISDWSNVPRVVRGVDVPGLIRNEDARASIMLVEMVTGRPRHLETRVLAVYLVPGLAVLGALLLTLGRRNSKIAWAVALASAGIAGWGVYQLARIGSPGGVVIVAYGQWISVGAYAGLAAAAIISSFQGGEAK